MSMFVITKRFNDEYKFEYKSRKGKTIFISNSFELQFECENNIEYIRNNINTALFLKSKSSSGNFFFRLIIDEKQFAVSRKYSTLFMLEKGINDILKYCHKSEVIDLSNNDFKFEEITFDN